MPPAAPIGTTVGGYRIVRLLGEGATGAVYVAEDAGGSSIALKLLGAELSRDERFRQRFFRESLLAASLDLAFATPRAWLASGKRIALSEAPTSFGPVSYSIRRAGRVLQADVVPPPRLGRAPLRLRLRLPAGERLVAVRENGRRVLVDPASTIRLRGRGTLHVAAAVASAAAG